MGMRRRLVNAGRRPGARGPRCPAGLLAAAGLARFAAGPALPEALPEPMPPAPAAGDPPRLRIESPAAPDFRVLDLAIPFALGVGGIVARATRDEHEIVEPLSDPGLRGALEFGDLYGDGLFMGGATVGLLGLGALGAPPVFERAGQDLGTSLLVTWGVVWALKLSVDAERPDGGRRSFPSGHTATAFAAVPVVDHYLGPWAATAAAGVATLTGMARLQKRRHYLADVLVGAGIGYAGGRVGVVLGEHRRYRPRVLLSARGPKVEIGF